MMLYGKMTNLCLHALGNVLLETLGPGMYVDATQTLFLYLNIAASQVQTFMASIFPNGMSLCFQSVGCAGQTLVHIQGCPMYDLQATQSNMSPS